MLFLDCPQDLRDDEYPRLCACPRSSNHPNSTSLWRSPSGRRMFGMTDDPCIGSVLSGSSTSTHSPWRRSFTPHTSRNTGPSRAPPALRSMIRRCSAAARGMVHVYSSWGVVSQRRRERGLKATDCVRSRGQAVLRPPLKWDHPLFRHPLYRGATTSEDKKTNTACLCYGMYAQHSHQQSTTGYGGQSCSWSAEQGKMFFPLSPSAIENLVSRGRFGRPVPRQPAHPPHLG